MLDFKLFDNFPQTDWGMFLLKHTGFLQSCSVIFLPDGNSSYWDQIPLRERCSEGNAPVDLSQDFLSAAPSRLLLVYVRRCPQSRAT